MKRNVTHTIRYRIPNLNTYLLILFNKYSIKRWISFPNLGANIPANNIEGNI